MKNSFATSQPMAGFLLAVAAIFILNAPGGIAIAQEKTVQEMANMADRDIPVSSIEKAQKDGTAYYVSLKELTKLALHLEIVFDNIEHNYTLSKL